MKVKNVLTENKKKKVFTWQWRNIKGKERLNENGRQMKRQVQVYEKLKLEDQYLEIKFKYLTIFKIYDICLRCIFV